MPVLSGNAMKPAVAEAAPPRISNREIARILAEIADLLEIKGENSFRIRSYRVSSETIAHHGQELAEMVEQGLELR